MFVEAGYQPSRTRIITGRALDVLPRLADGVYDLLFVAAPDAFEAERGDFRQFVESFAGE